ncbi:MAG TPA: APC family permease [Anaerolineae bacterium]|nr:APC family permease [Anaerolineae bacterium]
MATTVTAPRRSLARILFGPPLSTADAPHQAISKRVALAVFASDALSSVAYATQEILIVLALAGAAVFGLSIPIALVIAGLLIIVTISYRQTIYAYPTGGGAYIVSRHNLGLNVAQVAGAALLTDYILTVAVSISNGVEQIASFAQELHPYKVQIALAVIWAITLINLRGVKESGRAFAIPTYFFITLMALTLGAGLIQLLTGTLGAVTPREFIEHQAQPLTVLLVLRAFASGCTALTGIEAISDGVPAFKEPRSRNAALTLTVLVAILTTTFLGITLLAHQVDAYAFEGMTETVMSQIGRTIFGEGALYVLLLMATAIILLMAANTSFADFPRVANFMAQDGFLPRQLTYRGRRLVFHWGIVVLAAMASLLVIMFDAETTRLIPLYAVGVFLSFTLSQSGMVRRWRAIGRLRPGEHAELHGFPVQHDPRWRLKMFISGFGATMTGIVMLIFAVAKFREGAWIVVILIPTLVFIFFRIHSHYKDVARILGQGTRWPNIRPRPVKTLVLVDDVHAGTIHTINFAKSLGVPWTAVHVAIDPDKAERVKQKWQERIGDEAYLTLLPSPYRNLADPVHRYIEDLLKEIPQGFIHVIVGHLVMDNLLEQALHQNAAIALNLALQDLDRATVTTVSYRLATRENGEGPQRVLSVSP